MNPCTSIWTNSKLKDFINTRLWWCTGFSCSTHSLGLGLVGRGGALTAEGDEGGAAVSFTLEGDCRLSSGGLFKAWPFCRGLSGTLSWGSLSAETWTGSAVTLGQMSSSLIWKASALGGVLGGTSNKLISVGGGGNDWLSSNTLSSPDTPLLGNSSATRNPR